MEKISVKQLLASNRTMICFIIIIILLLLLSPSTKAQQNAAFNADNLSISFSPLTNNYKGTGRPMAQLIIVNKNKKVLPATGWKIYFNNKSMLKLGDERSTFTLVKKNGNLFQLAPMAGFTGLSFNEKIQLDISIDDAVLNKNDQPEGFYVVWDNAPSKGYDIKNFTANRIPQPNGKFISDFAETIYKRNLLIDTSIVAASKIFPPPVHVEFTKGLFILTAATSVTTDPAFSGEAWLLEKSLHKIFGNTKINKSIPPGNSIRFTLKPTMPAEGYELRVTDDKIEISASTGAGIFYGIQSLKTLMPADVWTKAPRQISIAGIHVIDSPRFVYRGFMLDVARNFQRKEEVFRILDLMALYKLNSFHFHLTEDEGWRLEIRGIPELTSFGATRGHTLDEKQHMPSAYGSGADTGKLYGSGFYTREDFKEILRYANERHIKVIPEIETPGHARAAIKAMDFRYEKYMREGNREEALRYFLRDTLDVSEYNTPQWFHDNVINVALPSVYTFIAKVVEEIDALYEEAGVPLASIHFGGDEVPAGTWEKSPLCNALIAADPALRNTNDLWYYYLGKINNILKAKGISLSGWEEIGLRKTELDGNHVMIPNPVFANNNMHLYVWNNIGGNEDLAYKLANSGYKVILAPVTDFYFDMTQYKTYDDPGYYWGSVTDISKTYEFIPFDYLKNLHENDQGRPIDPAMFQHRQRLTSYGKENVLGLEAAIWSETLKGPQQLEYMLLPRLAALSEKAWSSDPAWASEDDVNKMQQQYLRAWSAFINNIGTVQLPLLDHYNGGYNYRIPPAGVIIKDGLLYANTQFPNLTIRFSTNGKAPTATSPVFKNGMPAKGNIQLKVFNSVGRSSYVTIVNGE